MMMQRAVIVLAVAFFLAIAFQTFQLFREHANLDDAFNGQQTSLQQATQVRREARALAADTAILADKGNANAQQVVEQMRRQGIDLREPRQGTSAPAR